MSAMFNDPLLPFASSSSSNTTSLVCFTSIYSSFTNFLGGIQTELERWRTRQYHEYRHDAEPELVKAAISYQSQTMRCDAIDPLAAKKIAGFRPTPVPDPIPRISGRLLDSRRQEPSWDYDSGSSPPYFVVGRNKAHHPRISFFPHDGLGAGVAMGLAFYQEGMVMKQSSIEFCLPPSLRRAEVLPFRFKWPGYNHISVTHDIVLVDPETRRHVTYGRIAQQVAQVFSAFIQCFGDDFDDSDSEGGIRLGPRAVTFHNLRLHQVYIREGGVLDVEVSYRKKN
ncbi:hypothetical protein DFH08DRAFT_880650 [Mycena albidolilacea]|uniref:Uncharacterized protein n=1 Tax=Mycena albidolilacea TaxID=1033008 RepID=A0AAD6ZQD8_9AGAR|nr:hypothetical protein DFH08DRAFT_880650 [Mycena albidolilacea]